MNDVAFFVSDLPRSKKDAALESVQAHINTWLKEVTEPRKEQLRAQFDSLKEATAAIGLSSGTLDKQFLECAQKLKRYRKLAVAAGVEHYQQLMRKGDMVHDVALDEASNLSMGQLISTFSAFNKRRGADSS